MNKNSILDTLDGIKEFFSKSKNNEWRGYQETKIGEPNIIEICGRFLRRKGYDVELSYGDLANFNNCYLTVRRQTIKSPCTKSVSNEKQKTYSYTEVTELLQQKNHEGFWVSAAGTLIGFILGLLFAKTVLAI